MRFRPLVTVLFGFLLLPYFFCVVPAFPSIGLTPGIADAFPGREGDGRGGSGTAEANVTDEPVLSVDNVTYTKEDIVLYAGVVLGVQPKDEEVAVYVQKLALDLAGAGQALSENPGLRNDPWVTDSVRKVRARLLQKVYYREEVVRKVNPSDDELLSMLPEPPPKYELSVIILNDEGRIPEVQEALARGEAFEDCARKFSEGFSSEKGGSIGLLEEGNYSRYTNEEFDIFRKMKDGEVSRPFRTRIGWNIVRLDKFWSPEESKRSELRRQREALLQRKQAERFQENFDRLSAAAKVEWANELIEGIKERVRKGEPIPDNVAGATFATVNGVPLHSVDVEQVARMHSENDIESYLSRRVDEEIVSQEAVRLGYGKEIAKVLDMQEKHTVLRRFFRLKGESIRVGEEDLRKYYSENPEEFLSEEVRKVRVIETDREDTAREAVAEIRGGVDFPSVASRYNRNEKAKQAGGDAGYLSRKQLRPDVSEAVFAASENQLLGPLPVKGGDGREYFVVLLVEKIVVPSPIPFQDLSVASRQAIGNRIVTQKMAQFQKEFFERAVQRQGVRFLITSQGGTGDGGGK